MKKLSNVKLITGDETAGVIIHTIDHALEELQSAAIRTNNPIVPGSIRLERSAGPRGLDRLRVHAIAQEPDLDSVVQLLTDARLRLAAVVGKVSRPVVSDYTPADQARPWDHDQMWLDAEAASDIRRALYAVEKAVKSAMAAGIE